MKGKELITGKWLLKRILLTLALACVFLLFLSVVGAHATPIRPDIRKIVSQPQQDTAQVTPARAGWDGPEMPAATAAGSLPISARLARAERAELLAAATPDPRAVLAIAALIFLLRLLKKQEEKRTAETASSPAKAAVSFPITNLEKDDRLAA